MKQLLLIYFGSIFLGASFSKEEMITNIENWYHEHKNGYHLDLKNKAKSTLTNYHPERPDELKNLIITTYKGMKITFAFNDHLQDSINNVNYLNNALRYYSIDNIYHEIPSSGWKISPNTPQSSNRKGCKFSEENGKVTFDINWETFTVMGYRQTEACQKELGIADGSISENCMVYVRKKLPLKIIGSLNIQ